MVHASGTELRIVKIAAYSILVFAMLYLGPAYPKTRPVIPVEIADGIFVSQTIASSMAFRSSMVFLFLGSPFVWSLEHPRAENERSS